MWFIFAMYYNFVRSAVDCGDLISPEYGEVLLLQGSTLGATAIYSCDLGFLLLGTTLRQCEANGEWSLSEPSCSGKSSVQIIIL